jgi:hypothetical protein
MFIIEVITDDGEITEIECFKPLIEFGEDYIDIFESSLLFAFNTFAYIGLNRNQLKRFEIKIKGE